MKDRNAKNCVSDKFSHWSVPRDAMPGDGVMCMFPEVRIGTEQRNTQNTYKVKDDDFLPIMFETFPSNTF